MNRKPDSKYNQYQANHHLGPESGSLGGLFRLFALVLVALALVLVISLLV